MALAKRRYKVVKAESSWPNDKCLWMIIGPGLYISSTRYNSKIRATCAALNLDEAYKAGRNSKDERNNKCQQLIRKP